MEAGNWVSIIIKFFVLILVLVVLALYGLSIWKETKELGRRCRAYIIDTNVWGYPRKFFQKLIESGAAVSFRDLWAKIKSFNDVDRIMECYLKDGIKTYSKGIAVVKIILRLRNDKSVLHVPAEIWYETVYGRGSRMTEKLKPGRGDIKKIIDQKIEFFESLPLKTVIQKEILLEDIHFPIKLETLKAEKLREYHELHAKMITEAEIAAASHQFIEQIKELETETNKHAIMTSFIAKISTLEMTKLREHLQKANDSGRTNVELDKCINCLDDIMKKGYANDSVVSKSFSGKLRAHRTKPRPSEADCDVNSVIARRLVTNNEELVFFDLQMFLYAKKTNAAIITFNTKAFTETNDPMFQDYFASIDFLVPGLNFSFDENLNKPYNGCNFLRSVINFDDKTSRLLKYLA